MDINSVRPSLLFYPQSIPSKCQKQHELLQHYNEDISVTIHGNQIVHYRNVHGLYSIFFLQVNMPFVDCSQPLLQTLLEPNPRLQGIFYEDLQ